ncbi:MAG: beta-ketoacyl-ACP synthase II [Verrucomicrobiae bacterium]|nr:beta-ketoacyl-ACP synthase II [Verrucomicrobiae bacterium]
MGSSVYQERRRVVITGIGVVTSLGQDIESFWRSLLEGRSGISRITSFDASPFDSQIAAEIKELNPVPFFKTPKDARRCDRYSQVAMMGAKKAVADSGLDLGKENLERFGVVVGSGIGGLHTLEEQHSNLLNKGASRLSPFMIPMMINNMASGLISMEFGFKGLNMAVVSACSTAAHSIGESFHMILRNDADAMMAGGCEAAVCALGIGGFSAMKALSTRNDEPEKASRPFDRDRDGFIMGEASGMVILEELEHAKKRGARIYCEIAGYGNTADAYHMTAPSPQGEGAARCMRMALAGAGLNPGDVDYINAHGTSTPQGDICETRAIKAVFGEHARKLMISSTKSMTGHLLGAAGAVEMAVCAKALQEDKVPPTINLDDPDPECDLDYVPKTARETKVRAVLNNSFGFGGHNASLVARKFVG